MNGTTFSKSLVSEHGREDSRIKAMNESNRNNQNDTIPQEGKGTVVSRLLEPKAILFGFVIFYFIVRLISAIRLERENAFVVGAGWDPIVAMTRPFLLLVGALCVFIDRSWSHGLAILLVGNIIYSNVYLALVGISYAHGIPMFGVGALRIWLEIMSGTQIINTGLAVIILIFGLVQLPRRIARRIHNATTTEAQSTMIG